MDKFKYSTLVLYLTTPLVSANNCKPGLSGTECNFDINECHTNSPCENSSRCENTFGSYYCHCEPGTEGKNCEIDNRPCSKNPCQSGTCSNTENGFVCKCPKDKTGE